MTEQAKDKIKLKIRALLAKTPENGATEAEAIAALNKANELMTAYYIGKDELTDPYLGEKCIAVKVPLVKTAYSVNVFYGVLSQLFDCFHYYDDREITFFGFENDAKLAGYFYELIVRSAQRATLEYTKTSQYKALKEYYHGKTLCASFIKGFVLRVGIKIQEMYENRKATVPPEAALMIRSKADKVKDAYENLDLNVRAVKSRAVRGAKMAFYEGYSKGEEFNLTQGVEQAQKNSVPALN